MLSNSALWWTSESQTVIILNISWWNWLSSSPTCLTWELFDFSPSQESFFPFLFWSNAIKFLSQEFITFTNYTAQLWMKTAFVKVSIPLSIWLINPLLCSFNCSLIWNKIFISEEAVQFIWCQGTINAYIFASQC